MRIISNEEFTEALNNIDNIKIMNKASVSYSKNLKSRLKECKMIALWEALRDYKSDRNMKFSTYLYYKVRRKCYDTYYTKAERNNNLISIEDSFSGSIVDSTFINDILMSLDKKDAKLIEDKFIYKKTLKEIGIEENVSLQAIKQRLDVVLDKLREILS